MKPRVLISNDDGVVAPGLRALARELHAQDFCDYSVCGPSGERSAQSHCITIGKHLHAFNIQVEGATEAFAVDGTPADSVMLALYGPLLSNPRFDLVVSGINRGDNCGLHVIYSGTVGAAREAACKDIPAIAFSLDNHHARSEDQYATAAKYAVAIIKSALGIYTSPNSTSPDPHHRPLVSLRGHVLNVNFPGAEHHIEDEYYKGMCLTFQGQHCTFPDFREVDADPHFQYEEHHNSPADGAASGTVVLRAFRNAAGFLRTDERPGSDSWAVRNGYVSFTVVGLSSDVDLRAEAEERKIDTSKLRPGVTDIIRGAAKELGLGGEHIKGLPSM